MRFLFKARSAIHRGCSDEAASLPWPAIKPYCGRSRLEEMIFGLCISNILIEAGRARGAAAAVAHER
jgi:hypothetical protein